MLAKTVELVKEAQQNGYALGAFNVYNLEGVKAVVTAAESNRSPVILQIHPAALKYGGTPLISLCLASAQAATVPVAVHLDHSQDLIHMSLALKAGVTSIMADGAHLDYGDNVAFVQHAVELAREHMVAVEAELGLIAGTEDELTVADHEERMTDPAQAADFVNATSIDLLAVCVGNVHGRYQGEPRLDFKRLENIRRQVMIPLVMHGASGLPDDMIRRSIELGICKFNVNTELRTAHMKAVQMFAGQDADMLRFVNEAVNQMQAIVVQKLRLFGASNRTPYIQ